MSVTLTQQPQDYMPGYNHHWWTASSNQTAQPGFLYTIVVTDVLSSNTQTFYYPAGPDGDITFDSGPFARNLLEHYIPVNLYGWKQASIRQITVNIGETYDGSPSYFPGSDQSYYVWNGIVDFLPFQSYNQDDYLYTPTGGRNLLSSRLNEKTFTDRSNYLYLIVSEPSNFLGIQIQTYDENDNLLGQSAIPSYSSSPNYYDNYICIDVGDKGLRYISNGDVTGTYPVLPSGTAYYLIFEEYDPGGGPELSQVKRIDIECENTFPIMTIHYLAKNGRFQTVHFNKMSVRNLSKDETTYDRIPYRRTNGVYGYDYEDGITQVISTNTKKSLTLNTDWISESEMSLYTDLFDSPRIYLDQGTSVGYASMRCTNNSFQEMKRYNKRIFNITAEFEYNHVNARQY